MNHIQAVEQLAVERYLLDELTPDTREAFEEHAFDCAECALDLRAGTFFVDQAKLQLPSISDRPVVETRSSKSKVHGWFAWLRPAFVVPAFAALLGVVVFQNAVTFPALRQSANQPRLVPISHLRPQTRGARLTLTVDRAHGAALQADLPFESAPASYSIELRDAQGKLVWSSTMPANAPASDGEQQFSLYLPGAKLGSGTYTLNVATLDAQGKSTPLEQYMFDIVVSD
jgi:anti-sigma factor RsiW